MKAITINLTLLLIVVTITGEFRNFIYFFVHKIINKFRVWFQTLISIIIIWNNFRIDPGPYVAISAPRTRTVRVMIAVEHTKNSIAPST